jgi:hypothetical protein
MKIKEVAASLYPWDLADQTVETCVDNLMEHSNVNSVYLVGVMHKEKRPLTSLFYTLDSVRKYYLPENSRVYYYVDPDDFKNTVMKPQFTEREFLKEKDWLDELIRYAREKGLKTGVEISHTFYDTELAMKEHPELLQKDVYGKPIDKFFCSNNPEVKEYMKALFASSVKHHDVDFIQTCMMLFYEGKPVEQPWFLKEKDPENRIGHLLGTLRGGCFCPHCGQKARNMGYDWDKITADLQELAHTADAVLHGSIENVMENHLLLASNLTDTGFLLENPSLYQWLEFRVRCVRELFEEVYQSIKAVKPEVEFRYNNYLRYPEYAGLDFKAVGNYLDSVRDSDYSEQTGAEDHFRYKQNTLLKIRRGIGCEKPVLAAFACRPNATPELIKESLKIVSTLGIDGLSLGHYDGSTIELLDAVSDGMKEAGMELCTK